MPVVQQRPLIDRNTVAWMHDERRCRVLDDGRSGDLVAGLRAIHLVEMTFVPASAGFAPALVSGGRVAPAGVVMACLSLETSTKTRAFSDEVASRFVEENATKQEPRASFRFCKIGKRSSARDGPWIESTKACRARDYADRALQLPLTFG